MPLAARCEARREWSLMIREFSNIHFFQKEVRYLVFTEIVCLVLFMKGKLSSIAHLLDCSFGLAQFYSHVRE